MKEILNNFIISGKFLKKISYITKILIELQLVNLWKTLFFLKTQTNFLIFSTKRIDFHLCYDTISLIIIVFLYIILTIVVF